MAVWVIRAGDSGVDEYATSFFRDGLVIISFGQRRPIDQFSTRAALRDHIQRDPQNNKQLRGSAIAAASQLWAFAHSIALNDVVITPFNVGKQIAVGRIMGPCRHHTAQPNIGIGPCDRFHARPVEWLAINIPANEFIRGWFKYPRTVFRPIGIDNDAAQAHIELVVREHLGISG